MDTALALLVNCQCDLTEEGKEVYEAFQAEISPAVYRGADGCKVVFQPGDQEKSHKTALISLSPGSSGKWKTNGTWVILISSVCFSLENEPFSLAE